MSGISAGVHIVTQDVSPKLVGQEAQRATVSARADNRELHSHTKFLNPRRRATTPVRLILVLCPCSLRGENIRASPRQFRAWLFSRGGSGLAGHSRCCSARQYFFDGRPATGKSFRSFRGRVGSPFRRARTSGGWCHSPRSSANPRPCLLRFSKISLPVFERH